VRQDVTRLHKSDQVAVGIRTQEVGVVLPMAPCHGVLDSSRLWKALRRAGFR
jgi:hypothetical protein